MREERVVIGNVPARLFVPGGAQRVLLFGHGGGHSKDAPRFVALARRYAEEVGLAVVCIDAVDHGERRRAGAGGGLPRQWHSSVSDQMVRDWSDTVDGLSSIGPAVAYVGFSMGAMFGVPTVAAMASVSAAVFVVGGIPTGGWIDDAPLASALAEAAGRLEHADVLMLNTSDDEVFSIADVQVLFDAVRARSKQLSWWSGSHDEWPDEMIDVSIDFLRRQRAIDAPTS